MSRSSPARQGDQQGESSIVPGDRLRSAAEAILVVADEPVTTAALSEALGLEETATEALLETLAVIAYRQPVTRGRVSAIRGVNVDGVVRTLQARGLIEETGTEPSGAILYRTTDEFLEYLGVNSLEDLPPLAPYLPDATVLDDIENETIERSPR